MVTNLSVTTQVVRLKLASEQTFFIVCMLDNTHQHFHPYTVNATVEANWLHIIMYGNIIHPNGALELVG